MRRARVAADDESARQPSAPLGQRLHKLDLLAPDQEVPARRGHAHFRVPPPSTSRLTPFTPRFSSRKTAASTMSSVVTSRPIGVRARTPSSTAAGLPLQAGV